MFVDYINCLLEFSSGLVLFLTLVNFRPQRQEMLRYYIFSLLFSVLFICVNTPLLLNISIFLLLPFLSFSIKSKEHLIFMSISVMCIIYLKLMCYSLLPVFLLQTNTGNLVTNIIILVFLLLIHLFSSRRNYNEILNPLLLHHKLPILLFLLFTVLLGQSYLSRLSYFWSYLPGVISVSLFLVIFLSICIYIHYARSADKLHIHILVTHINDIEAGIHSLRIQNHDYKHHIRNLRNQINTATSLDGLRHEVNTYIDQMEEDRLWLTSILNINQPVLRSVVYGCYSKCLQENISFNFSSSDQLPNFPLKEYQLVELLENLIANAIEQNLLLPTPDRSISVCFFAEDRHNEITISNPVTDSTLSLSDMFIVGNTTKDTAIHQGLGLSSIQKICSTNHITFYGQRENETVSFSIVYEEDRL